jgi:predicted DsbA family dithiol-disulfide isomerase
MPLSEYFGASRERVATMQEGLRARAADLGLPFQSPEILSNTRKAHILSEYSRDLGKLEELHRELFRANFVEGLNLGDDAVLREMAARAGLDPDEAMAALEEPRYVERVEAAFGRSRQIGITGVPTFIVEGKYMIVGAHPFDALRDAFRRIAAGEA